MPKLTASTKAVIWELWTSNRLWVAIFSSTLIAGWVLRIVLPDSFVIEGNNPFGLIGATLVAASWLILMGIFNYTQFNPEDGSTSFPQRLYTLPLTSLTLVAVPMGLGVISIELFYLSWSVCFGSALNGLVAAQLATFMVLYLTILWTLARFGALRLVVLGVIAMWLLSISFFISLRQTTPYQSREIAWVAELIAISIAGFLLSWFYIAHARCNNSRSPRSYKALVDWVPRLLHRSDKPFTSAAAAQLWFEWRHAGQFLPVLVALLLLFVILPVSFWLRHQPASTISILIGVLALPTLLALPVGKGFSKPEFWSRDLSLPPFLSVRPLAADEIIAIKLRAAAVSAVVSWALTVGFVAVWLPLWADLTIVRMARKFLWEVYGVAIYPIVGLFILAGIFVTWRFLVGGLWIGLSGNRHLYATTVLPYSLAPIFLLYVLLAITRPNIGFRMWIRNQPDQVLFVLECLVAAALVIKLLIVAATWSRITSRWLRRYGPVWALSTVSMVVLAILIWSGARRVLSPGASRLRDVLILSALVCVPIARVSLAPRFLHHNRHR